MTSIVYVIADLHFGHEKLAVLRGYANAKAHDDALVAAWNGVVTKRDVVYVLGDLFRFDRVPELLGTKKLAPGNHDQAAMARYVPLFSKIQSYFDFDNCLLSHIPVHPSQFPRWQFNVHGHTHAKRIADARYIPVSIEQIGIAPVPLRALIQTRREGREILEH